MEPQKIIFVHIFKTGGTTLKYKFRYLYGKKFLYDVTFRKERKRGVVKLTKSTTIFEPSNYKDYDIILGHFTYQKYKHLNRPTVTLLRDPLTRFISHYSSVTTRKQFTFEEFCDLTKNIYVHFTGGDLNNFEFVGLTEYFDKSLKIIGKKFGYNFVPKTFKKMNQAPANIKKELTENQIKHFQNENKEDYELYNQVLSKFREMKK